MLRVAEAAFLVSGVSVLGSLPLSAALPDLPGIALVATGGLAVLLSIGRRRERLFKILATLVGLMAILVVSHVLFHRRGMPHDWLEPFYVGAVLVYCGLAISAGWRLFPRRAATAFASVWLVAVPNAAAQEARPDPGQQVVLVTGSTGGLGREVARRLASGGAHVIVHGRNRERGMSLVAEIEREGKGSARFYAADFASLDQVRGLGEAVLRDYDRLDVLVNNAGVGSAPDERVLSEDGHEYRFQVNYLSGFLLTHILLPRLMASTPSRIVNVSSLAQRPIDFDDVMIENNFSGGRAYSQSKLAQIMFTFDLHDDLEGSGVMVNSLHPATYMPTEMVARAGVQPRATIAEGADAVMQLIVSTEIEGGQFFRGLQPARANNQAYDLEARAKLQNLSKELTGGR